MNKKNLGIFVILILLSSVVSITQTSTQFVSGVSFSNEQNDLEHTAFFFTRISNSLISDTAILVKNNLKIQAIVFDNDAPNDSVAISDSVFLMKHVPIVYDSKWDTVAISERITERTKSEKSSNISTNQLSDKIILDKFTLTNQNEIISSYVDFKLFETTVSLTNQLNLIENNLVINTSTQNVIENSFITENNSESFLVLLLAPFAGFVLLYRNNFKIKQTSFKQFPSYVLILIILSSTVLTPVSIGSSYWGFAYAELDESSNSIDSTITIEPFTGSLEPIDTGLNATSTEPIDTGLNATSTEPIDTGLNATSTEPIDTGLNATSTEPIDTGL
ncbi:MAG: hypothetical protein IIB02_09505, partial [Thaumarchaeota archaeon]|nr:hypothetical protein [Nitrososphaerota archaeon]